MTEPFSDAELARLDELAGKATPGPWRGTTIGNANQRDAAGAAYDAVMARRLPDCPDCEFSDLSWVRTEGDDWLNVALIGNGKDGPKNAAYIAALDPATVRRLIAAAEDAGVRVPGSLDVAWTEAEKALPDGYSVSVSSTVNVASGPYVATTDYGEPATGYAYGPTPAAALLALAAALRSRP